LTQKDANGVTTVYGLAAEGGKWAKWVNQNGGAILDDYVNPSACMLADPASVAGVEFFADLMDQGIAMRPADLSQAGGDASVFMSGQAAMILQNTSRVSAFNSAGMNYDVAPAPIPAGGKRWNAAGGAAWVMSSGSDNKDAAWTFLSWLQSNGGGVTALHRGRRNLPVAPVRGELALLPDRPAAGQQAGHPRRSRRFRRGRLWLLPGVGRAGRLRSSALAWSASGPARLTPPPRCPNSAPRWISSWQITGIRSKELLIVNC
jgi:multiple sugar transport system substrate-binding protein